MPKQQFFTDAMWPPTLDQVKMYFSQKGMNDKEAEHFFECYQLRQWRTKKGEMIKRWKTLHTAGYSQQSGRSPGCLIKKFIDKISCYVLYLPIFG